MLQSPFWLPPSARSFYSHYILDSTDLPAQPWCEWLSFGKVTVFSESQSTVSDLPSDWQTVALKVLLWAATWMISAFVKNSYNDHVLQTAKTRYLQTLQNALLADHSSPLIKMDIVAEVLRDLPSHQRIVISNGSMFSCTSLTNSSRYEEENRETIQFFYTYFGERRTSRLFRMMGIDIAHHSAAGLPLTRRDIVHFLALTAFVHIDDMHELHLQLQVEFKISCKNDVLHLNPNAVQETAKKIANTPFDELNQEQYQLLWDIMVPLRLSTMFVDRLEYDEPDQKRARSLEGIIKALYIEQHHLHLRKERSQGEAEYSFMKSSTGAFTGDHQASILGKVINYPKGFGTVNGIIAEEGGFCITVKAMGATKRKRRLEEKNPEGKHRYDAFLSRCYFLPMQTFSPDIPGYEKSVGQALSFDIGAKGALGMWPQVEAFLTEEGQCDFIGTSKGAVEAANLSLLAISKGLLRKITLICAPGVQNETAELFAKIVKQRSTQTDEGDYTVKVRSMWHYGDRAHLLGKKELATCALEQSCNIKQKIHLYHTLQEVEEIGHQFPDKPRAPESYISAIFAMLSSLIGSHREDLTFDGNHQVISLSSVQDKMALLRYMNNEPLGWDSLRDWICRFFSTPAHFVHQISHLIEEVV